MDDIIVNKHGIRGYMSSIGTCFHRRKPDGTYEVDAPLFVPLCCVDCPFFDHGEFGDYGQLLSGPYCTSNLWFPTKKGSCKTKDKALASKSVE
jgi:hypothetical protein